MFTNQEADYLLNLPKKIIDDDVPRDSVSIRQQFPFTQRLILGSEDDREYIFLMEVT